MKRKQANPFPTIARLLRVVSQPARLKILLCMDGGEVSVSELEARLQLRQAYISQQLMALRKAGLVSRRRAGRNAYYRLADRRLTNLIRVAGCVAGEPHARPAGEIPIPVLPPCECRTCRSPADPEAHGGPFELEHDGKRQLEEAN